MRISVTRAGQCDRIRPAFEVVLSVLVVAAISILTACGTTGAKTQSPTQPSYPSVPPVPITWSPQTSPLPAPPALVPPPSGSNDFPLTISSPSDGGTVTSPATVVASASPKNPIFFMRVYVDQLAVYFTFTNSINTQILIAPGTHTLEVMAEDNQGYLSATILNITVSAQSQTTISDIQTLPGWQSCSATFPAGSGRWTNLRRRIGNCSIDDDRKSVVPGDGWKIRKVLHGRADSVFEYVVLQSRGGGK